MNFYRAAHWIVLFSLSFGSVGCGKLLGERYNSLTTGFTRVSFGRGEASSLAGHELMEFFDWAALSRRAPFSLAIPGSHAVVYAVNQADPQRGGQLVFTYTEMSANPVAKTWLVPNGTYYFSLVGFDGVDMSSNTLCGRGYLNGGTAGDPIHLSGGAVQLHFTGTTANCNTGTAFKPASTFFTNYALHVCDAAVTDPQMSGYGDTSSCNSYEMSAFQSAMLSVPSFNHFSGTSFPGIADNFSGAMNSSCEPLTNGISASDFIFPIGNTANLSTVRLRAVMTLYTNSNCTGASAAYYFARGIAAANSNSNNGVIAGTTSQAATARDTSAKFAWGASTARLFLREF